MSITTPTRPARRRHRLYVGVGLAVIAMVAASCGSDDSSGSDATEPAATDAPATDAPGPTEPATSDAAPSTDAPGEPLTVALLVPGLANDGSFNQVAREAIETLEAEGLVEFELREELADPAVSEPVARQYAEQGYDLIIGHGIELSEPLLALAAEYPDVEFTVSGGPDIEAKLLDNVDGWTYDFAQQGFLSGFVAANIEGIDTVGVIGGPELPFIQASHAGFTAGVAEVDPDLPVVEAYTGSFDDVQAAVEATNGLIAQGADVVFCSGDGICNGVATAAAEAGIVTVGVTGAAGGLQEQVNVASVELDMTPTFRSYVEGLLDGSFGGRFFISGLANEGLVLTPVNTIEGVPVDLATQVDELVAALASGEKTLDLGG